MAGRATDAIRQVQGAIDTLATALASGDAGGLLGAEATLAASTEALTRVDPATLPADRDEVRRLVLETKLAIARCRRLGAVATDLSALYEHGSAYGRDGRVGAPGRPPTA